MQNSDLKERSLPTDQRVLLVDDTRNLKSTVIARSYWEGMKALRYMGPWDVLLLDHDLASYCEDGIEKTGYHLISWLEENQEMHPEWMPKEIVLVTDNPVGRERMKVVIDKINQRRR